MEKLYDERFEINNESVSTLTYNEHIVRYLFASNYVSNLDVLDIACGTGYGTQILGKAGAKKVIGVDLNKQAISKANISNKLKNVNYKKGNACNLDFKDKSFDLIISFETIEHIKEYERFLSEIERVLRNNGVLIISTPNYKVSKNKNPFHEKEFTKSKFKEILKKRFKVVKILNQINGLATMLIGQEANAKILINNNQEPEYFVAICSNCDVKIKNSVASVNSHALTKLKSNPGLKLSDIVYTILVKISIVNRFLKK